jgi:hypothetical protein
MAWSMAGVSSAVAVETCAVAGVTGKKLAPSPNVTVARAVAASLATLDARPLEGFIGSSLDVILRPILTKRLQRSAERPDSLYATRGRLRFDRNVTVMFLATARTVPNASGSKPGRVRHVERAETCHPQMFASTSLSPLFLTAVLAVAVVSWLAVA